MMGRWLVYLELRLPTVVRQRVWSLDHMELIQLLGRADRASAPPRVVVFLVGIIETASNSVGTFDKFMAYLNLFK
jgi:hypothetical protein